MSEANGELTEVKSVGIIGAGQMGNGIAHVFAVAGYKVCLSDISEERLAAARESIEANLDRQGKHGKLTAEDLARFSCRESDLAGTTAPPHVRALMRFQVQRARDWLARGGALVGRLSGAARLAVAGYRGGGEAALDAIARADYDVLRGTPRTRRRDVLRRALGAWVRGR